ncbi:MAG TPA: hypothetical protein VGD17_11330 [Chitinophagaceae bacterium]
MKKSFFSLTVLLIVALCTKAQSVPGAYNRRAVFQANIPTTSFTVPTGVTLIYFEACSGGGGRGGSYFTATPQYFWGGGGGGGAFLRGYLNVSAGQVITVSVGNGGTNGSNGLASTGTVARPGNAGAPTSLSVSGTVAFTLTGGQPGNGATATGGGSPGVGGGLQSYNTPAVIVEQMNGFAGFPGSSTGSPNGDYSGVGGIVPKMGLHNYFFPFIHFVDGSPGHNMYYLAPYFGTGAGKGTPSSGGYVFLYW